MRHQTRGNPRTCRTQATTRQPRGNHAATHSRNAPISIANLNCGLVPNQMNDSPTSSTFQFGRYLHPLRNEDEQTMPQYNFPVTCMHTTRRTDFKRLLFDFSASSLARFAQTCWLLLLSWCDQYPNIFAYSIEVASLFSAYDRRKTSTCARLDRNRKHQRRQLSPVPAPRNVGPHEFAISLAHHSSIESM